MGVCGWEPQAVRGRHPLQCLPLQDVLSSSFAAQFRGRAPKQSVPTPQPVPRSCPKHDRLPAQSPLTGCKNTRLNVSRHPESPSFVLPPGLLECPSPRGPLEDAHPYSPLRSTAVSGLRALKPDALGSHPGSSSQDLGGSSVQPHSVCSSLEQASNHPPGVAGRLRHFVASTRGVCTWLLITSAHA